MGVIQNPNGSYQISNTALQQFIPAADLLRDTIIWTAHGFSTVHADMDFETYSEAGFEFHEELGKFKGLGASKKGLSAVGSAVYAQHPSTEVNSLAYNLKDGLGPRLWNWGEPPPWDLIHHFQTGCLVEAHNSLFEYFIWTYVCVRKLGWPPIDHKQLRCSMSKASSFALPASLEKLSEAINAPIKKDTEGRAIMLKLSQPRTPTKADASLRYDRIKYRADYERQGVYCINDTAAESEVSAMLPDLSPDELELWLLDQQINIRGVHIDRESLENCISVVEQAFDKYSEELRNLCGSYVDEKGNVKWNVSTPAELANIRVFLAKNGVDTPSLDAEALAKLLAREDLPSNCRRVLEIRDMLSAASVKKLFSLLNHLCDDDRVRGLFAFCGADRTGRFAGRGPQPQNFPSGGPKLSLCDNINGCGHYYRGGLVSCPWCGADAAFSEPKQEWTHHAVEQALKVIASRNLYYVEYYYGDPIAVISGCLRGLFTAAPSKDLICSDFSAIEAVVLAELAGEAWRQEVFRTHGKIYEMGAAKITGTPFEEFMRVAGYPDITKEGWWVDEPLPGAKHHPLRKTIGKVSELACFGSETLVLTHDGYKRIVDVDSTDKLWDGFNWVTSSGVVERGVKYVSELDGVLVTLDHKIATQVGWQSAHDVLYYDETREDAYSYALELSPEGWHEEAPWQNCADYDVYGETYDIADAGPNNRFTVATNKGHLIVHNSGYAGWIGAWKNFGADKFMTDQEIKEAILVWREASPMIVELWGGQWRKHPKKWEFTPEFYGLEGAAVQAVMNPGVAYGYRSITFQVHGDVLYCRLPSGRMLSYHTPRLIQSTAPHGNPVWQLTYMGQDAVTNQWVRLNTYGGKLVENCLIGSSQVLTKRGWVRLDEILPNDFIHDGVEFVNHGGLIHKSVQPCVNMDGVLMTENHYVLSNNGWETASQCERPYRPDLRHVDVCGLESFGRKKESLVFPMRVLENLHKKWLGCSERSEKGWYPELWVRDQASYWGGEYSPRNGQAPCLRSVEIDARPLSTTITSSVAQLWWKGDSCLRTLAAQVRKLLGRHGRHLFVRDGAGSEGQQRRLLGNKLSMGDSQGELQQPAEYSKGPDTIWGDDNRRYVPALRVENNHYSLSDSKQLESRGYDSPRQLQAPNQKRVVGEFPVYDILNCGPRNRFVVKGDGGPFIVHNCTQAVARDILVFSLKNLEKAGYPIVLHIHDEIVAEVDKGQGSIEEFERIMAIMPPWASDWPIRAAGGWRGLRYRKG